MNYLNTFIKAKNLDKQMVMDYLQGQDQGRDPAKPRRIICSDCAAL